MPNLSNNSLATCIQALQKAIKLNDYISQSDTVDSDDFEESSYMYELELSKLCSLYKSEEQSGNVTIPLNSLLQAPFDELANNETDEK